MPARRGTETSYTFMSVPPLWHACRRACYARPDGSTTPGKAGPMAEPRVLSEAEVREGLAALPAWEPRDRLRQLGRLPGGVGGAPPGHHRQLRPRDPSPDHAQRGGADRPRLRAGGW